MANNIARSDPHFDIMQKQFITSVGGTPDKVGLLAADVTGLKTAQTAPEGVLVNKVRSMHHSLLPRV